MSNSQLSIVDSANMPNFTLSGDDLKEELIGHLREEAEDEVETAIAKYPESEYDDEHKKRARYVNRRINNLRADLENELVATAKDRDWSNEQVLPKVLALEHAKNIVILESRNDVWKYEYMAFSRRIGEIWEPFCHICYEYSIEPIQFFSPPSFEDIKQELRTNVSEYIRNLSIDEDKKENLLSYYENVWILVQSGDINMSLDLHFYNDDEKFNIDFKSGFSSNEKGNVNRLLMVATIYDNIEWQEYKNVLLVRSEEDRNNNYFQTLKQSDVWDAFCGSYAYNRIHNHTGFDLGNWVNKNIEWEKDFRDDVIDYFNQENLDSYLIW